MDSLKYLIKIPYTAQHNTEKSNIRAKSGIQTHDLCSSGQDPSIARTVWSACYKTEIIL
jgi:hypothetical protein